MLIPLEIPPGIVRTDSPNAAKGRFTDGDKVRFYKGKPEKWSGWVRFVPEALLGICRGAVSWSNKYGNTNAAFGTHLKLYALAGDDALTDITPIRTTVTLGADPFETENGSHAVIVTHTTHGADNGDYVTFDDATAVGGITIDGEYQIVSVVDPDHYIIEHSTAATSDATGGGAVVEAAYQINVGTTGGVVGLGWGAGKWGASTWSTPRADGIPTEIRFWSVVEYGNDLMASPYGKTIYFWEEATDDRAETLSGAPAYCRAMFVTGERFVFALGAGADGTTPMTVRWHYCSTGHTEPDSYVDVTLDGVYSWTVGTLERTGGTPYRSAESSMLLVDDAGVVYSHGTGVDADGEAMESYITFGLYAIERSESNVDVMGLVPDCQRQVGDLTYEIYTKERPNSPSIRDEQIVTMAPTDEIGDCRVEGRHFGMTVRSNVRGGDYRLGIVNLEIGRNGARR
jgi:hypothetical protein